MIEEKEADENENLKH